VSTCLSTAHRAEVVCRYCRTVFVASNAWLQFCSDECRLSRARERILQNRDRNARWCAEHRKSLRPQPWLAGPPPFGTHLPGVAMSIGFDPHPRWPIALRNTRGLHGAITTILSEGHRPRLPLFSLFPIERGWGVHFWCERGTRFALRRFNAALFDRPTAFSFGPAWRLRAPSIARRGRQRMVIDTITPVVIRADGGAKRCVRPTSIALQDTLAGEWLQRFGLEYLRERDLVRVECVEVDTEPVHVPIGGKYGVVHGWAGRVVVECNAPARWLLEVGARVGIGSRTAFGCGRIRVST
jgi:hypothetical protein